MAYYNLQPGYLFLGTIGVPGCDRAIPNPNLLIKSFAHRIKYLLKSIVLLYSPGSYANTLEAGPRAERWLQAYIPTNS